MKSAYNYIWLYRHFKALNDEFMNRFPKNKKTGGHKSFILLGDLLSVPPKNAPLNVIGTLHTAMLTSVKCMMKTTRLWLFLHAENIIL